MPSTLSSLFFFIFTSRIHGKETVARKVPYRYTTSTDVVSLRFPSWLLLLLLFLRLNYLYVRKNKIAVGEKTHTHSISCRDTTNNNHRGRLTNQKEKTVMRKGKPIKASCWCLSTFGIVWMTSNFSRSVCVCVYKDRWISDNIPNDSSLHLTLITQTFSKK